MLNNIIAIPPVNNFVIGARMKTTNRLGWMKTKRKPLLVATGLSAILHCNLTQQAMAETHD